MEQNNKIIKGLENWVKNHKDQDLPLAYSSVCELLAFLNEQEAENKKLIGFINGFSKEAITPVRCKDCIYGEETINGFKNHVIACHNTYYGSCDDICHEPYWYCADGEKGD